MMMTRGSLVLGCLGRSWEETTVSCESWHEPIVYWPPNDFCKDVRYVVARVNSSRAGYATFNAFLSLVVLLDDEFIPRGNEIFSSIEGGVVVVPQDWGWNVKVDWVSDFFQYLSNPLHVLGCLAKCHVLVVCR